MKRNLYFVIFVLAMALLLISCKSTGACAYDEQENKNPTQTEVASIETEVTE